MLGYRGNPDWRDMSEYVVHFTKHRLAEDDRVTSAYEVMLGILAGATLKPGIRVGAAKGLFMLGDSQRCVCLSEIPLDLLRRLVERRSAYGIGFTKEFIIRAGGAPVWYLDDDGIPAQSFRQLVQGKVDAGDWNVDDPIWQLARMVDYPGDYAGGPYRFEWEREWRIPRDLVFTPDDVAFLFLPESQHQLAATFFQDAVKGNTGPGYFCPFVDPAWPLEKIQEAVSPLPVAALQEEDEEDEHDCEYCGYMTAMGESLCLGCGRQLP